MGDLEAAERLFLQALASHQQGELAQAEAAYEQALELAPGRPSVMNNLAAVYLERGRVIDARRLCESLLQQHPQDGGALVNLGNCLLRQGSPEEALACYDRAIAADPGEADACYNRGHALRSLKRDEEALASYERAIELRPGHDGAHFSRAGILMRLGRMQEALASYDRVLEIRPGNADVLNNRALVLQALGRRDALIENYARLLEVAPDYPYIRGYHLHAQLDCCEWRDYETSVARVVEGVRAGERADSPFHFLAVSESAADQLRCAQICIVDEYPPTPGRLWQGERYRHDRIRLAYVSADLHNHAVPHLIAGLLEAHDRSRFEVIALSLGPDRRDPMRARLQAAVDRFIDVRTCSDGEAAALIRELEVDIAVDLQGFTHGCRPGIFARRAAPVQVNYLGYPGTMGADYMDYIVADRHVIPEDHAGFYSEKIAWLPDCYQANDIRRAVAEYTPTRAELGLPEDAFVFCCFNNNYKIAPPVFDIWMSLLRETPGSVLWLLEDNAIAASNLRREAARRGVAPDRLVFAPRVGTAEHLARQRRADLFLDTRPYNAHVTASDALWVGLPLVTCRGDTFASRVAASLLNAAGMNELVTASWDEYGRLALALAADSARLSGIRDRLARSRARCALFDADRFRRHIESAFITMHERVQNGQVPESFAVEPSDGSSSLRA